MATNSDSQLLWSFSQEDLLAPNTKKRTFSNWIGGLHFTSDASRLAVATEGEIAVYDIQDGRKEILFEADGLFSHAVHFSPDDRLLAAGSSRGTVYVIDLLTKTLLYNLEGHSDYVRCLAFSSDGGLLFSGSEDRTIRCWSMHNGTLTAVHQLPALDTGYSKIRSIAVAPSGGIAAGGWIDSSICVIDLHSGSLLRYITENRPQGEVLALSPDGRFCITSDGGYVVSHYELPGAGGGGVRLSGYRGHAPSRLPLYQDYRLSVKHIKVSSDGNWVISTSLSGGVHFTRPMASTANFILGDVKVSQFDFSPASGLIAGATSAGVQVWKVDPTKRNTISRPPSPVRVPSSDEYDSEDDFEDPYPWKDWYALAVPPWL